MLKRLLLMSAYVVTLAIVCAPQMTSAQDCFSQVHFRNIFCGCDVGIYTETFVVGEQDAFNGYQDGSIDCGFDGGFECTAQRVDSCITESKMKPRLPLFSHLVNRSQVEKKLIVVSLVNAKELAKYVGVCKTGESGREVTFNISVPDALSEMRLAPWRSEATAHVTVNRRQCNDRATLLSHYSGV